MPDQPLPAFDCLRDDGKLYFGRTSTVRDDSPFGPDGPKVIALVPVTESALPKSAYEPKRDSLEHDALQVLFERKAFSQSTLVSTKDIAQGIYDKGDTSDNANRLNAARSTLKREGVITTVEGRRGGCWLTEFGRALAERLLTKTGRTVS